MVLSDGETGARGNKRLLSVQQVVVASTFTSGAMTIKLPIISTGGDGNGTMSFSSGTTKSKLG